MLFTEDEISRQLTALNERQKELWCLYTINTILKDSRLSLDEMMNQIILEIPNGYQFPENCQALILLNGKEYKPDHLIASGTPQMARIRQNGKETGEIRVYCHLNTNPPALQHFLLEEQKLIDTIAESISQTITLQHYMELMKDAFEFSDHLKIPVSMGKWLADQHLSQEDIKTLLTTPIRFKKGELILKQGAHASYAVLITEGLVKAYLEDINSHILTIKIIKPFDFIGLSSIFGKGAYGFSATAITASSGYLVKKELLKTIAENNTKFNFRLLNWYSDNFELLYHKMNLIGNKQAFGRIADVLLYLWDQVFDKKIIENNITRKVMAELSGMSVENAVRILSELKSEGVIVTRTSGIEIVNPEKLRTYILVS